MQKRTKQKVQNLKNRENRMQDFNKENRNCKTENRMQNAKTKCRIFIDKVQNF